MRIYNAVQLILALVAVTFSLMACGDDSPSDGDAKISSAFNASVDESASTFSIFYHEGNEGCVFENGEFIWKTDYYLNANRIVYKYSFVGDTMVFQEQVVDGGNVEFSDVGFMLVGGHAGSVYGTWRITDCVYQDGAKECGVLAGANEGYEYRITPDSAYLSRNYQGILNSRNSVNLMDSRFMSFALSCMNGGFCDIYDNDIFYDKAADVKRKIRNFDVQVVSQDKSSARLIVKGDTVDIKVNEAIFEIDDQVVDISVSVNGETCNLKGLETLSVKPYCSTDNADFFDVMKFFDENGFPVEYVYSYANSNAGMFEICLVDMFRESEYPGVLYTRGRSHHHFRETDALERFLNAAMMAQ